jgi:hypothetical protein
MTDETSIMNRLLSAIADSENDHPGDDGAPVDLSRQDAFDAVKRISDLLIELSDVATALYDTKPDHPFFAELKQST